MVSEGRSDELLESREGAEMTAKVKGSVKARYVTATDVAAYFSVSPNTVSRWAHMRFDPLPKVYLPGMKQPRYDMEKVQEWAERQSA